MRGGILYYSVTGNTALAVESLANRLPIPFSLVDVTSLPSVDIGVFDVVGFASSTDFWGVPRRMSELIERLPVNNSVPAFVINTFGGVSGKTLPRLGSMVSARGFDVIAGHSLHMPDSYPPLLALGIRAAGAPSEREIARFDAFASQLSSLISAVEMGGSIRAERLPVTLVDRLFRAGARTAGRDAMGDRYADAAVCTQCGTCASDCPAGAIHLDPLPVFDTEICCGCWRCYNRCPVCAIRTGSRLRGEQYSGPSDQLRAKLP
ncbi:MAG: hypothetical protein CVT67_04695 [Actinobacteria bacterium HGW-Actinobacteria-7]|nr:MAG: hypothetical protein CVT67_04695 [Actinobacteria bacterium HGW-Actinobacteria-7]